MSDAATPGWYHAEGDPPNTERYWDGSMWTEGPRPVGGFPAAPPTPAPMAAGPGVYGAVYSEESQATTALVLSILGLFCCLTAPVGVFLAYREKGAIDAGRRDPKNRSQAVAALVIGLAIVVIYGGILMLGLVGAAATG